MMKLEHSLDADTKWTNHHKSKDSMLLVLACSEIHYKSKDSMLLA